MSDTPTVSILCRTMGNALLVEALRSVAQQTYPAIELVLVDASGQKLDLQSGIPAELAPVTRTVSPSSPLDRPRAANLALDSASGDYLLFLDEDDWINPDHVERLVGAITATEHLLVYSSARKVNESGEALGILFDKPFDAVSLKRDNYIPIHSALFSRELLKKGCRFDETLPIYEDWDFWLQCAQHTGFVHVDNLSAFYRAGGRSDTAAENEIAKYQKGSLLGEARAAVYTKWLPRWSSHEFNVLLGSINIDLASMENRLHLSDARLHESEHQLQLAQAGSEQLKQELADRNQRNTDLDQELQGAKQWITDLQDQITKAREHQEIQARLLGSLQAQLDAVHNSRSWRLTRPLRWLGRSLQGSRPRRTDGDQV
jgi:glycosyltransferase involved in cell wall biosynthesis